MNVLLAISISALCYGVGYCVAMFRMQKLIDTAVDTNQKLEDIADKAIKALAERNNLNEELQELATKYNNEANTWYSLYTALSQKFIQLHPELVQKVNQNKGQLN